MSHEPLHSAGAVVLTRIQARRLREVYRSAGWPSQDGLEIELLAAGLLARDRESGHERVRLTDTGIASLAQALQRNQRALSAHDALVGRIAQMLLRDGRLVWTALSVRARLPPAEPSDRAAEDPPGDQAADAFDLAGAAAGAATRWKVCKPDVFSIRNTTVAAYLQPVVHEIKVSRADLLGDLRLVDKRDAYLDLGGQCWYVLGCDARGRPIGNAHEVPSTCGVIVAQADGRLEVLRHAPTRSMPDLPFAVWMALAKSTALPVSLAAGSGDDPGQTQLTELAG